AFRRYKLSDGINCTVSHRVAGPDAARFDDFGSSGAWAHLIWSAGPILTGSTKRPAFVGAPRQFVDLFAAGGDCDHDDWRPTGRRPDELFSSDRMVHTIDIDPQETRKIAAAFRKFAHRHHRLERSLRSSCKSLRSQICSLCQQVIAS